MAMESNLQRNCGKCARELVNASGVHMGIPFGIWKSKSTLDEPFVRMIVCAKCYDEITLEHEGALDGN